MNVYSLSLTGSPAWSEHEVLGRNHVSFRERCLPQEVHPIMCHACSSHEQEHVSLRPDYHVRMHCLCTGRVAPLPAQATQHLKQGPSQKQNAAEPSGHGPGLPDAETQLEAALEAGTAARLQAAIHYTVRAIAAANSSTNDLSRVRHAFAS